MLRLIFILFVLAILSVAALPFLLLDDQPMITSTVSIDPKQIDEAKAFLKRTDPRQLEPGEIATVWVDERELSLAVNYLLSEFSPESAVALELHPGYAYAQASYTLPDNPIGRALNVHVVLTQSASSLHIESVHVGRLVVPRFVAEPIRRRVNRLLYRVPEYQAALRSLNGVQLLEDRMIVVYQWDIALVDRLKESGRALLVDDDLRERLLAYSHQIREVSPSLPRTGSMVNLLEPVFLLAQARGGDPVEENRAALLAMSLYFSGVDVARLMNVELHQSATDGGRRLTLSGRYDFAQHFLTSAALTLLANNSLADSIGIFKELDDASGGSGFSFTDVGADRAGVRVAELATLNAASARYVQNLFAGGVTESDFMPNFLDLPELMDNSEFQRRYGGVDDPRYQSILDSIEEKLDRVALFQNAP